MGERNSSIEETAVFGLVRVLRFRNNISR